MTHMSAMRAMQLTGLSIVLATALPVSLSAQTGAPADAAGQPANCTDVQVGSAQSYDCLNAQLGAVARNTQRPSSDTDAPVTAASPSNVVGTFNQDATRERLGANFGKSVTPYRPSFTPGPSLANPR